MIAITSAINKITKNGLKTKNVKIEMILIRTIKNPI